MSDKISTWPGKPYPLGATYDGIGVNFSLFAEHAESVELCLFDSKGKETKIPVLERTHNNWHIYIPGMKPGQQFGFRVHGVFDPKKGSRFNPNKLLLCPYSNSVNGSIKWNDALFGYRISDKDEDLSFSNSDSAAFMPKSVVTDRVFDWQGDALLRIPLHKLIIYELHVKGFTQLAKNIPERLRGTYSGISHDESLNYFKKMGINALELMPIHQFVADRHLVEKGLTNYWGYNTICFFAPDVRYTSTTGDQVAEFKQMVKTLHRAGIEVILDVVYNHTAEGNHMGPTLSFRGIDNQAYWKGDPAKLPEFANRFTGSSDLYLDNWRTPVASINFITAHDGFTLMDLVSYNDKHNEANGENNQDGENYNRSWNCGAEGPTDNPDINSLRKRQIRNFLTTLFLSQGVPMLVAGDELGRTQKGNNNAYCQDNEISWIEWENNDIALQDFTAGLINFRLKHPSFCRNKWFQHKSIKGHGITDIEWFQPDGTIMSEEQWNSTIATSLAIFLSGELVGSFSDRGDKITDDSFYIIFNSLDKDITYYMPGEKWAKTWYRILDTFDGFFDPESDEFKLMPGDKIEVRNRSVVLLINRKELNEL